MAGKFVHFEILAGDTARARAFWSGLFGWQFEPFPGPVDYHIARIDEQSGAAVSGSESGKRGTRAFFDVDDIKDGVARVQELGGEAGDPSPVPKMGWFVVCKDVEGNEFGLWQTDPDAPEM